MPLSKLSDEELVARSIASDLRAFEELIGRYESKLLRYVRYMVGDSGLAQDAVQETFIKIYQNLQSYNPQYKFSSRHYGH
ncbi:hypothetical protein B7Y94_01245 [Candidatus Saccharibacteria bacterium 32-49-12]|nr:MAG: hypothetical protein B7Y94_01245 [Candidatus Saccharibacteria bacterium 32-49-12]